MDLPFWAKNVQTCWLPGQFSGPQNVQICEPSIQAGWAFGGPESFREVRACLCDALFRPRVIALVADEITDDRNPVSSLQCASVVPRLLEGLWRLLERLKLVNLVQSEMERLLGAIPSYQPCKHEAECLKKTSSLRIRVVEPVLGMIIAGLVAEEQASESSTKPRWGDGKFSLISKSPRLHRHQQGDEELLLLADRRVTSVVCLESKQDPVLNKYGRVLDSSSLKFPKAAFRLADQEATRLRVKKPATFKSSAILLKSGLQLATASIDYQLDVRFGIVCGAYLGFVTEKVRLPELHKGDFGVLFSPIFQSLPTTSFETHYPTVSLAMVLLALCLSDVLEVEEPSPDVVAALFKDAQFEAEDDTTDSSFRSGSDTEGSLYMDTEAPSSDSN